MKWRHFVNLFIERPSYNDTAAVTTAIGKFEVNKRLHK